MEKYRKFDEQITILENEIAVLKAARAAEIERDRAAELPMLRAKAALFGLKASDLGLPDVAKSKPITPAAAPRYYNPANGKTWSGRGNPPKWIKGQDYNLFRIVTPEPIEEAAPATGMDAHAPTISAPTTDHAGQREHEQGPGLIATQPDSSAINAIDSPESNPIAGIITAAPLSESTRDVLEALRSSRNPTDIPVHP